MLSRMPERHLHATGTGEFEGTHGYILYAIEAFAVEADMSYHQLL